MQKISVTIITLNEEANIRACLESVKWADEILISDSGSSDRTVEICRGGYWFIRDTSHLLPFPLLWPSSRL